MEKFNLIDENWTLDAENVNTLVALIRDVVGDWQDEGSKFEIGNGWVYELEHREGGYEGAGEVHFIVFSLSKNEENKSFWEMDGYYAIHGDGAVLDSDPFEVEEKEKVVTLWARK